VEIDALIALLKARTADAAQAAALEPPAADAAPVAPAKARPSPAGTTSQVQQQRPAAARAQTKQQR
jgi:hypothetical protein